MTGNDTDDLGAGLVAWLQHFQSAEMTPARVREPAAAARRLASLADAADKALPFGAEPSGFTLAQRRLMRGGETP